MSQQLKLDSLLKLVWQRRRRKSRIRLIKRRGEFIYWFSFHLNLPMSHAVTSFAKLNRSCSSETPLTVCVFIILFIKKTMRIALMQEVVGVLLRHFPFDLYKWRQDWQVKAGRLLGCHYFIGVALRRLPRRNTAVCQLSLSIKL